MRALQRMAPPVLEALLLEKEVSNRMSTIPFPKIEMAPPEFAELNENDVL